MKLSIIIPVFNEKNTIKELISRVRAVNIHKEIIIIDDCSTDGTREILREIEGTPGLKIFYHEKNCGKGTAIRRGIKHVSGDIVIIQDADLEYHPQDYFKLMKPIIENQTNIVYGSRILNSENKCSYLRYYYGGRFLTWLTNFLYGTHLSDVPTCYKMFKTDTIKNLPLKSKRFEFCEEVTALLVKKGEKIVEIPISYNPRHFKEGKKIRAYDGLIAIWTLFKHKIFCLF